MGNTINSKPGTYNGEDAKCLCYCSACDKELAGPYAKGKKAHWVAKDLKTGQRSRKHVDRNGKLGLASWHPYGSGCAKKVIAGAGA